MEETLTGVLICWVNALGFYIKIVKSLLVLAVVFVFYAYGLKYFT